MSSFFWRLMEVDNCVEHQLYPCPRDLVKPMSLVMEDHHGSQSHPRSSALRVSTKSKAPSPPGLKKLDSPSLSQWYPGNPPLTMEQKENLIDKDLSLVVVLPGGIETRTTVHGSKPLMDLLVTLCAQYHLNPSGHTLELVTPNKKNTKLKPNALIGTLDAEKILLKPKGEDKNKKTGPQMPEATVRMVINYKKTQKTILRVSPRVPLAEHLEAICEKCEFDIESTILLRDVQSLSPLDLSSSLNDYSIREVYARDTKAHPSSPVCPASPTHAGTVTPGKDKNQKEEENKGLFSKFRKSKKKSDQATTASAPASPVLVIKPRPLSMAALPSSNSSLHGSMDMSADAPKKRRAPAPPLLVSQSCQQDASPRRRLHSEPAFSEQKPGLSRNSSAESSLKRTKRKAPPPPTSPSSTALKEPTPLEEQLQVGANALEEIMEQEESAATAMSAAAGEKKGEDKCNVDMSTDPSLRSPSSGTGTLSTASTEGDGEDQSRDLSSDGNQLRNTVNDSAILNDARTSNGTESSEPADTNGDQCQAEHVSQQSICEDLTPDNVETDVSTVPISLPKPVMQDAEAQASVQETTETVPEQTDQLESTSRPDGEDVQFQTDFTTLSEPAQGRHKDQVPSSPAFDTTGKKDAATLTEEVDPADIKCALSPASETLPCQPSTESAPGATKAPSIYATNSEPKPKPSNELTRDYIPKVGMTTYTIVPQKTLEKLRYFEVALTLEAPGATGGDQLDVGSLSLDESTAPRKQTEGLKEITEIHSAKPGENLPTSTTTTSTTTTTTSTEDTVNGGIPEWIGYPSPTPSPKADDKISSPVNGTSQVGSPTEVKPVKIPPATKPKPGSFRFAQHKKTPGHYVTSAAEKSPIASPDSVQQEVRVSVERFELPPPPPPHQPTEQSQEEVKGSTDEDRSPRCDQKNRAISQVTRQSSLPCKEPSVGLSLEKLRSFAAPRPYSSTTPSRFAQAVSSAVKRSQSLSHGQKSPRSPVSAAFFPTTGDPSGTESKGLSELGEVEKGEAQGEKGSTLQGEENETPSLSETVQMSGESGP